MTHAGFYEDWMNLNIFLTFGSVIGCEFEKFIEFNKINF